METDDLIEALASESAPVPSHLLEQSFAIGTTLGGLTTVLLVTFGVGLSTDLSAAADNAHFWSKAGFSLSLGFAGLVLSAQFARPEALPFRWAWLASIPVAGLLGCVWAELAFEHLGARFALPQQQTGACISTIGMLALPIFCGLVWAYRQMAPTRLRMAGASAGLTAGGLAAAIYSLACVQASPSHILTNCAPAILLTAAIGAALGPRLLRW